MSGEKEKNTTKIPNDKKNCNRGFEYKDEQAEAEITPEKIKEILKKRPNWKASGCEFD